MKIYYFITIICLLLIGCSKKNVYPVEESLYEVYAPDGIPFLVADSVWKADMQGNHRAIVTVESPSSVDAVVARLPWRRPDLRPQTKKIVVIDATTGEEIKNVDVANLTSEEGIIIFEPKTVPGKYYIYYLPYKYRKGWNDARYGKPWNDYLSPDYEASPSWIMTLPENVEDIPAAKVLCFESRSRFDFFTKMGTIATKTEMDSIRELYPENPIIFTEDRAFPIRLTEQLPVRWIKKGPSDNFSGSAMRNEYYVWQIGIWAAENELKNIKIKFTDFVNQSGKFVISQKEATCFNTEGINWDGNPISFAVNVPEGKIQALWCGIQIPENATSGVYKGKVTIIADEIEPRTIDVELNVNNQILADRGDSELWKHARLRWLNSIIGIDSLPVTPYKEMILNGNEITATDKHITVGRNGLPNNIHINDHEILEGPFAFIVETSAGSVLFDANNLKINKETDGLITWSSSSVQKEITFECNAYMEYDGYLNYKLKIKSSSDIIINDVKLITSYTPYASEYFMGTGFKGGLRPITYRWDWKGPWDSYWIGGPLAGLHVEYRGASYNGPLLNDYKPLPPKSWSNDGKGYIILSGANKDITKIVTSTENFTLNNKGIEFEFALLITPVKPVNPSKHFSERYYHSEWQNFDKVADEGPNIANIHHSKSLNPVINYPFIVQDSLKIFISHEHEFDRKVKLYYTIRELTNYTKEIYALKSLNHEIFVSGVGYGLPWHTEHLIDDYKPAWYTEMPNETSDAALVLSGFSRWINYYLEGLRWMFENYSIDGIYMDDVSFDRNVMKRMRKIIERYRPGALIDLHSNTGYSIGPANQYADFFPYVDRLWFGESFRYNTMNPDEWFVTFSGIPFGQMSEMLQDGGNRFLGMVYGTTARHSYGEFSPAPVWALWKSFGIEDAVMKGYWDNDCPIKTNVDLVKATTYIKKDSVLISLGNFDTKDHKVRLSIDWDALNMNSKKAKLIVPAVKDFQEESAFLPNQEIPVTSKEGWLFILTTE